MVQEVLALEQKLDRRFDKLEQSFADYCQKQNERMEAGAKKMARHEVAIDALRDRDKMQNGHAKETRDAAGIRIERLEDEVRDLKKWIMYQLAAIIVVGIGAVLAIILT